MGRTKTRKIDDSDEDTFSSISSTDAASVSSESVVAQEQDEEVIIEGYIDSLYEKRSTTREAGLKGLINTLSSNVLTDFIQEKHETLVHLFLGCVKRGSSSEAALASRALGLVGLTAGAGEISENLLQEAFPHLVKVAKTSSSPGARIAAVEALSILTFVGSVDSSATESSMEVFRQIFCHRGNEHSEQSLGVVKPTPPVKAAAINAWSLLLSIIGGDRINSVHLLANLPVLSSQLEVQDLGVRKAAGEAIALLYETADSHYEVEDSTYDIDAKQARVVDQLKALAIDAGRHHQTKKERSEQRSIFRDVLALIEGGVCKETAIKLQYGDVLRVQNWAQTVQLNGLRRFLAEGFQKHMQANSLLHEIFDFVPRSEKMDSRLKKLDKAYMSPNSVLNKKRTLIRKQRIDAAGRTAGNFTELED